MTVAAGWALQTAAWFFIGWLVLGAIGVGLLLWALNHAPWEDELYDHEKED